MDQFPVIPGFHPDPSVCRAGDMYYLATSSFEYAPGVPIFRSTDLVVWEQIGNALDRPSQLRLGQGLAAASSGIYAPTLRFHDGRFWLITTNIGEIGDGHLLVHADSPEGPWSEPVRTAGLIGIDPDLAWDADGVCHLTWSDVVRGGISQAVIDPDTGRVLSEPKQIWTGTGGAHPEGPHLVHRDGWWYLLVAEGGTGPGHMVTIARSRNIHGPFDPAPTNPVLSHRSTDSSVQSTGHSDLVQRADGSWALVYLGTRPRGSFPRWHTNGRETFLAEVSWVDDWPVIDESLPEHAPADTGFEDTFREERLHPRWVSPGAFPASFAEPDGTGLRLARGRARVDRDARRMIAVRVQDEYWSAQLDAIGEVSFSVRVDDAHQAILERAGDELIARIVVGPLDQVVARAALPDGEHILEIRTEAFEAPPGARRGPDLIRLGFRGPHFVEVASFDGRYLSTEVAGGFTGRVVGIEALDDDVTVRRFAYRATPAVGAVEGELNRPTPVKAQDEKNQGEEES